MSTALAFDRAARFWDAPIGKKAVMAITGLILFGFVIVHMLGNLQLFLPPDASGKHPIDVYGEALHHNMALLWTARAVLLASVGLHILAALELTKLQSDARPVAYHKKRDLGSSYASRTMMWSGPMIACFLVYHLLHFTTGAAHPQFRELAVHHNVVTGFQNIYASLAYIAAMLMLGPHLFHGAWSMFQTLGVAHPRYTPMLRTFAKGAAVAVTAGNISLPVAVLSGVIR